MQHYGLSEVVVVDVRDGGVSKIGPPRMYSEWVPAEGGCFWLVLFEFCMVCRWVPGCVLECMGAGVPNRQAGRCCCRMSDHADKHSKHVLLVFPCQHTIAPRLQRHTL